MSDMIYSHCEYPILTKRDFQRIIDPPHFHNYLQVWYVHGGSYIHYHQNMRVPLHSGAVAIVPPWCTHYADARHAHNDLFICNLSNYLFQMPSENSCSHSLCFSNLCLTPLTISFARGNPFFYPRPQTVREIFSLNYDLYQKSQKRNQALLPLLRGKTAELMSLIAEEYAVCEGRLSNSPIADYCPSVNRAFHLIHEHYQGEITAEQVARGSMLSTRTFFRIFKEIMGMTFVQYLQYLRILHAKELLETTDRLLVDIAYDSGFQDVSSFHRTFRQQTGFTPRGYRMFVRNRLCAYPKLPSLL